MSEEEQIRGPAKGWKLEAAPVTAEDLCVVVLPGGAAGGASLGVEVALAMQATVLAAGARDAADLSVLVGGVADPVGTGILHATTTSDHASLRCATHVQLSLSAVPLEGMAAQGWRHIQQSRCQHGAVWLLACMAVLDRASKARQVWVNSH